MAYLRNDKVSYWRETTLRFKSATYYPRYVFNWIIKMFQYAPILWNDVDWDHSAFLRLMKFKLSRMRKNLVQYGMHVGSVRNGKQIAYAEFLIDRILADDYFPEIQKKIEDEFGELEMNFTPVDDMEMPGCSRLDFTSSLCKTDEENERASEARHQLYLKQDKQLLDDKKRLFRHIDKYMFHWWS